MSIQNGNADDITNSLDRKNFVFVTAVLAVKMDSIMPGANEVLHEPEAGRAQMPSTVN